jgi:hypothetical protein
MNKVIKIGLGLAAVLGVAAVPVSSIAAPTVTISKQSSSSFGSPRWEEEVRVRYQGDWDNEDAGLLRLRLENSDGSVSDLNTFSIQLNKRLDLPEEYSLQYFDVSLEASLNALWSNAFGLVNGDKTAAAFQIAVWDLIYDDDFDVTHGDMRVNGYNSTEDLAQDWLDKIESGSWLASPTVEIVALRSWRSEDLLFTQTRAVIPPPTGPNESVEISAPATGALMVVAGLLMLARRRRRWFRR